VIKKEWRMPAKLLIADDSTTIQKVFERTFPPEEFTLSFVDNGEEALTKARADRPNVIIADINMPAKNGFELCAELKKDPALKGIPVLLLIGILDDFDEDESRRVGADGFIVKPFEANAAVSKVREALSKAGGPLPAEGPAGGQAEEIMEPADIVKEPPTTPPPQEKTEEIMELADIVEETTTTPPPQEKTEEIMELQNITEETPAAPTPSPPQEKKEGEEFVLESPLRELEKELKSEFPEEKVEDKEVLESALPEVEAEDKEDFSLQQGEVEFTSLDLDLPFEKEEPEPQAKDTEWTGLFGDLSEEIGQETDTERLGTILEESSSELEKIEGLTQRKDEEPEKTQKEEEFAEKFMDDFEPVFEPEEDLQHIDTKKDLTMNATKDKEDLAERVASAVGHELKGAVEKMIKEKVPELVRQEIDRLKKE
jgi:CheY-like chemotaxis protein